MSSNSIENVPTAVAIAALSLHDALPIFLLHPGVGVVESLAVEGVDVLGCKVDVDHRYWPGRVVVAELRCVRDPRSEEHTSELQSRRDLVCRLLLEKKKKKKRRNERTATR